MQYVALLRGINLGKRQVKMDRLKTVLESAGYADVKTLLASGNVIFSSSENSEGLGKKIETLLQKEFGFEIPVILRTKEEIESLIKRDPFKGISVTKETRLYVTFRSSIESERKEGNLQIPYVTDDGNFRMLSVSETEICSVLIVTPDRGTVDLMGIIEKEYGKNVTTRNWNTVEKIAALLS